MKPSEFLTALWGEKPPGKVLVWTMPGKKSHWLNGERHGIADITNLIRPQDRLNVYTAMLTVLPNHPEKANARYKKSDRLAAMACLWADIDIKHEAHKKKKLPEDRRSAIKMLESLEHRPTILIDSGHGIQAFWVFEKPWTFGSMEEQEAAARTALWWHHKVAAACREQGWTPDSVWDITRVMRLPGYVNHKPGCPPVPVTVIYSDGPRLKAETAAGQAEAEGIPDEPPAPGGRPPGGNGNGNGHSGNPEQGIHSFSISADARPPADKLEAMLDNIVKFKQTWQMKRRDIDESPSGYDMSLASYAIRAGWSEQETVNLLIAFRRRHNLPSKLRADYYRTTLDKAQKSKASDESRRRLSDAVSGTGEPEARTSGDGRETIRRELANIWGFRIRRLVKTLGDPPEFWMITDQGEITFGKIGNLIRQTAFRETVAACTGKLIQECPRARWNELAQAILSIAEEEDLGIASHPKEEIREWTLRYLEEKLIATEDQEGAINQRQPFVKNGKTNIFQDDFRIWLKSRNNVDLTAYALSGRMKRAGFGINRPKLKTPAASNEGGKAKENRTTRYTWTVPRQWLQEAEEEPGK